MSSALADDNDNDNVDDDVNRAPYVSNHDNDKIVEEVVVQGNAKPVLLNSKEHAVGYLGKVLNARVYEAAIETKLQLATNMSDSLQNTGMYT